MNRFYALVICGVLAASPVIARAQMSPAPMTAPASADAKAMTPAEAAVYANASAALHKLYPTPAAAIKAGWFRYNNEDDSGAISYMNPKYFDTPDVRHPQQLWYDVNGRLLGCDLSQTVASHPDGPTLFGMSAARFGNTPLHDHYALKHPDGTIEYGLFVAASDFTAAGLDPLHPTAANLVLLRKVKRAGDVAFVFANLHNYDATMWLIPNPAGQFEDKNPNVKPSADQGKIPSERRT